MVELLGLLPQEGLMVILHMVGLVVMRLKMMKKIVTPKPSLNGIWLKVSEELHIQRVGHGDEFCYSNFFISNVCIQKYLPRLFYRSWPDFGVFC
jgi:hypothetical protein